MLKQSILIVSTALFFSACSLKMPTFEMPSFLSFSKDSTKDLEEANVCQKIESDEGKLTCYKNMETKNSFAQIRLGAYYADKKDYKSLMWFIKKITSKLYIHIESLELQEASNTIVVLEKWNKQKEINL